jgi:hypothetical protein
VGVFFEALIPLFFVAFWVAILGGGFYIALRLVRSHERRTQGASDVRQLEDKIHDLEETLDSTQRELARLTESSEFTIRLLTERSSPPETPPPPA